MNPKELITKLSKDKIFQDWDKNNPGNFLSHLFCQLNEDFTVKSDWEIGYYANEKVTIFVPLGENFNIKPADDIFKKPGDKVQKLSLNTIKVSFEEAVKIAKEEFPKRFPGEPLGGGFVILQHFKENLVWNFTFITKRIKFINLKINAENKEILSHNTVNLIQQGPNSKQN